MKLLKARLFLSRCIAPNLIFTSKYSQKHVLISSSVLVSHPVHSGSKKSFLCTCHVLSWIVLQISVLQLQISNFFPLPLSGFLIKFPTLWSFSVLHCALFLSVIWISLLRLLLDDDVYQFSYLIFHHWHLFPVQCLVAF